MVNNKVEIHCGFVINNREPKNHSMMINKFLSEKDLQKRTRTEIIFVYLYNGEFKQTHR